MRKSKDSVPGGSREGWPTTSGNQVPFKKSHPARGAMLPAAAKNIGTLSHKLPVLPQAQDLKHVPARSVAIPRRKSRFEPKRSECSRQRVISSRPRAEVAVALAFHRSPTPTAESAPGFWL